MLTLDQLTNKIKNNNSSVDLLEIEKAYNFAKKYHKGQQRKDGTPFIQHPLHVAYELTKFKFDTKTFVAALLHDVIEDTKATPQLINQEFGNEVLKLVLGATKLSKIKLEKNLEEYSIENLRKMFLAMAQDIRVVIIKLADRYHNLKTLRHLTDEEIGRIAKETMEIYVPLANRLGMGELKGELEDLAFSYLYPADYQWTKKNTRSEIDKRKKCVEKIKKELEKKLDKHNVKFVSIHGRAKHYYSLFKKLKKHEENINKIYDLIALRIIVKKISDCYKTLGIIHQYFKPLLGRIKDYIAVPKVNGYQSLHTTVLYPPREVIEIQIRTEKMHLEAEYGIAAAWYYKEEQKTENSTVVPKKLAWINELVKWQKELQDNKKFAETLKIDFFKDRIFVFTPNGEVFDLPEGSTPVDFAYYIHTEVGNHCKMAKVNDRIAPLDYQLKNGDIIKIITSEKEKPKRDWLNFVYTTQTKNKIQSWFKKQNRDKNLKYGKNILNQELLKLKKKPIDRPFWNKNKINQLLKKLNYKKFDDLLVGIAQGDITPSHIIKNFYSEDEILTRPKRIKKFIFFEIPEKKKAIIENEEGLLTNIAKCCHPKLSDEIVAHITRNKGASIHKENCLELKKVEKGRIVKAKWLINNQGEGLTKIKLTTLDRIGLISDISTLISNLKININNLKSVKQNNDTVSVLLTLELKNLDQLFFVLEKLKKIKGVLEVEKI